MMEDWTDIMGEELESIEEPLPADDWSVLQQKYAAARKRRKAAAFAWAGGIMSVAAAVSLLLLLVRPDPAREGITDLTGNLINQVAGTLPPADEIVLTDTSAVEPGIDAAPHFPHSVQRKAAESVTVVRKDVEDVFLAEDRTEEIPSENSEETFDVIRDTTSMKDRLLADASASDKKETEEDGYVPSAEAFGFDDFPEESPKRSRPHVSLGISGSSFTTGSLRVVVQAPTTKPPLDRPLTDDLGGSGSDWGDETLQPDTLAGSSASYAKAVMKKTKGTYTDSYDHEVPVSVGLSARIFLTDRLSVTTGLDYTRYTSVRNRYWSNTGERHEDKQYAHYLGVPVRIDWMAVNRTLFSFYIGAGMKMDKCIYAAAGKERLYEKQVLWGLNGVMGVQVNVIPMLGLYLEPEVSYALNEGSIKTFRSDEPFMISARAGIRFNF